MTKKVALVLSAGGARGYAHIGVIEEILNQGFEIASVTGASMGALIGGIYALGKLEETKQWLLQLTPKEIFSMQDLSVSMNHIVKGEKIINKLNEIAPDQKIETLSIPYRAIATDIKNEQEIVFDRGSIYAAIRASISIPAFFSPLCTKKMTLVDGGLVNPLPINRIPTTDHDLVIAVNVYGPDNEVTQRARQKALFHKEKMNWLKYLIPKSLIKNYSYYTLLVKSFRMMIQKNASLSAKLYQPDILINIPMNRFSGFDYEKAEKIINYGKEATQKALNQYKNK